MKHRQKKTNRLVPRRAHSVLSVLAAALMVLAFTVGCDGQEVTVGGNSNDQSNNDDPPNSGSNNHSHEHDEEYFEAHGPDDDMELIPAGELQGSWRAAFVEGDRPLAYFDIFHDEGESEASGDFTQGLVPHDFYDGTTGSLDSVVIDGDQVEVNWNPTDQDVEMFTLTLERDDDETYTGTFEAAQYPNTYEAEMTLQVFDDE